MTAIAAVAAGIIPTCAGVGGGGRKLLILISVQEMIVQVDGERQTTVRLVLLSVEWTLVTMIFKFVHLLLFSPMEEVIRMCVV